MTWQKGEGINAPDKIDRASALEEMHRQAALQHRKPEGPGATGYCLHCGKELDDSGQPPKRWCNPTCRDEWEAARS